MGLVEDLGKSKEWDIGQVHGIGAWGAVRKEGKAHSLA